MLGLRSVILAQPHNAGEEDDDIHDILTTESWDSRRSSPRDLTPNQAAGWKPNTLRNMNEQEDLTGHEHKCR